jgi:dipeptidyl aminopeptidase/acylaminoacyl peptidase
MIAKGKVIFFSVVSILAVSVSHAAQSGAFSMPDSVLLFRDTDVSLKLVSPDHSASLSIPAGVSKLPVAGASLGPGGGVVSWGFPVNDQTQRSKVRCAVEVYSVSEKRWRTYGDFSQIHATAMSKDGSKVAFTADDTNSESRGLFLHDVGSGQITKLAKITAVEVGWSPDGRKIVLGLPGGDAAPQIMIFDIDSHSMHELVEGDWPSWSPSGDWIAYLDHAEQGLRLVRPDGTDNRILKNVGSSFLTYRMFGLEPVWSPDGKKLLLNEFKDEGTFTGVMSLDIDTARMTRLSNGGAYVLGWVARKD